MLLAVGGEREALHVSRRGQRDHHLLVGDHVLDPDVALEVGDLGAALVAVGIDDLRQLVLDQGHHPGLVGEDRPQLADPLHQVGVLAADLVGLQRREPLQSHVEDRLRLLARELELLDQPVASAVRVLGGADQLDHRVEVVERDQQPLENVGAGLGAAQLVLGAPGDDLALVLDVVLDQLAQAEGARDPVDERHHVDAERRLHRGLLVEVVENDLGRRAAALQLDHQPHAAAVRLVAQVGDPVELLLANEVGDLGDQAVVAALLDHEGQLGDDDRLLAPLQRLDVGARPHPDAAAARRVGVADPLGAHHPAAREVGALDVLHQPRQVDLGVVDVGDRGADRLAQVVGRDVGRHPDRDPGRAVDEQVREPGREDQRLALPLVVVGAEVDRVGVDVAQQLGGEAVEARLGVAHRRRRVVVDRAEVALPVDQRVAQRELLRHPDQGVVDRRVAVRVVRTHDLTDDEGGLAVGPGRLQAEVVHRVEDPAVHGLQPVAHVGQRPADDHAHRVIDVGRAHLLLELALLDASCECL